jgi:hypothetical protein
MWLTFCGRGATVKRKERCSRSPGRASILFFHPREALETEIHARSQGAGVDHKHTRTTHTRTTPCSLSRYLPGIPPRSARHRPPAVRGGLPPGAGHVHLFAVQGFGNGRLQGLWRVGADHLAARRWHRAAEESFGQAQERGRQGRAWRVSHGRRRLHPVQPVQEVPRPGAHDVWGVWGAGRAGHPAAAGRCEAVRGPSERER